MKKEIALSIEQMKHLEDLGLDCSGASMSYLAYKDITDEWVEEENCINSHFKHDETSEAIISLELGYDKGSLYSDMSECSNYTCCEVTPTFSLQDILELLPKSIKYDRLQYNLHLHCYESGYSIMYSCGASHLSFTKFEPIIEAAYEVLCWCIEEGHIETNKTK